MNDIGPLDIRFPWWFWMLAVLLFPVTIAVIVSFWVWLLWHHWRG